VTALDELEKRLEGPGLIVALTKDEARDLLSAAREGERLRRALTVDALAQEIRRVDGDNSLGAGALAEALVAFTRAALQSEKPHD
jgi:hypothetical protein